MTYKLKPQYFTIKKEFAIGADATKHVYARVCKGSACRISYRRVVEPAIFLVSMQPVYSSISYLTCLDCDSWRRCDCKDTSLKFVTLTKRDSKILKKISKKEAGVKLI